MHLNIIYSKYGEAYSFSLIAYIIMKGENPFENISRIYPGLYDQKKKKTDLLIQHPLFDKVKSLLYKSILELIALKNK